MQLFIHCSSKRNSRMISIAMATYNGERYLQQQIDSILNQTVKDIELIICDDSSTDGTWNLIQDYQAKFPFIKGFRNETNLGFKLNFEKAMSLCTGEFVALSDQDDIWEIDHLETLLNLIGNNDIACGNAELIDSNGNSLSMTLSDADFFFDCPKDYRKIPLRVFYNYSCFQGASMLIRRPLLEKSLPIPEGVNYHDTWLTLMACYSHGFASTKKIITRHRRHGANASSKTHWPTYLGFIHIKRSPRRADRPYIAEALKERLIGQLSPAQLQEINHIQVYYKNRNSKFGKLKNLIFRCMHYSSIYTTKSELFIEW